MFVLRERRETNVAMFSTHYPCPRVKCAEDSHIGLPRFRTVVILSSYSYSVNVGFESKRRYCCRDESFKSFHLWHREHSSYELKFVPKAFLFLYI